MLARLKYLSRLTSHGGLLDKGHQNPSIHCLLAKAEEQPERVEASNCVRHTPMRCVCHEYRDNCQEQWARRNFRFYEIWYVLEHNHRHSFGAREQETGFLRLLGKVVCFQGVLVPGLAGLGLFPIRRDACIS